jgi:hypothetical protein
MDFSKKTFILLTVLFSCLTFSQTTPKIIGEWIGTDSWGNESKFIFSEDNYISMTINGEFIDGKSFVIKGGKDDGKTAELKYNIDYSKSPVTIDFIAIKNENDKLIEKGRILCIANFISDTEMMLLLNFIGKRETNFDDSNKENMVILRKK